MKVPRIATVALIYSLVILGGSIGLSSTSGIIPALWPSLVALVGVWLFRRVMVCLIAGALSGCVILAEGNPALALYFLMRDHVAPLWPENGEAFLYSWKMQALTFTLLLGGFAALIESGGGLQSLILRLIGRKKDSARNLQLGAIGLGFVCFFDGLANSLLLGRVTRSLAGPCGVSKVKMAYLVDSTSSSIACIAFVSTWIATQLSLIENGLTQVGQDAQYSAYAIFFSSIPSNYYVLFTLWLMLLVVWRKWDIGPMQDAEEAARAAVRERPAEMPKLAGSPPLATALIPLGVLVFGIMATFYLWEAQPLWPVTPSKFALAFSSSAGALILVIGSILGVATAWALYPRSPDGPRPLKVFGQGARNLMAPLGILVTAWILGSVIGDLKVAELIGTHLEAGGFSQSFLPLAVFATGMLVSFSTGTSWGTMGLLMPIAVPLVFVLGPSEAQAASQATILATTVGAVFGGAVFGDHCSPFSDTTIVSSIACEVDPVDHVRTQLPYALIAATTAVLIGYLPIGFGWLPPLATLLLGAIALYGLTSFRFTFAKKPS